MTKEQLLQNYRQLAEGYKTSIERAKASGDTQTLYIMKAKFYLMLAVIKDIENMA